MTKLRCTVCWTSFPVEDDFDWGKVVCAHCGFKGEVVGRIIDEEEIYFADEDETALLPVLDDETPPIAG